MSKQPDKPSPKRRPGEQPQAGGADPHSHVFEVEQDPDDRVRNLVDNAEQLLDDSERRLASGDNGSRAVALHGIGYALCSIACSLEGISHSPAVLPGDVAPDDGGHQWYRGECLCCGIGIDKALPACAAVLLAEQGAHPLLNAEFTAGDIARAFSGPVCGDGSCASARLDGCYYCARHMPEGTVEIEVAVATICVDCQAAHEHGPARCLDVTGCAVCVGADPDKCASCGGELVLDQPAVQSDWLRCGCAVGYHPEDRYAAADTRVGPNRCSLGWVRAMQPNKLDVTTCVESSNWCSQHCPIEAAPAPPEPGQACGGQLPRCLEHCA